MIIKVGLPGKEVAFNVTFSRKHRRYSGCMMIQGESGEHGFSEISPKNSEMFEVIV